MGSGVPGAASLMTWDEALAGAGAGAPELSRACGPGPTVLKNMLP